MRDRKLNRLLTTTLGSLLALVVAGLALVSSAAATERPKNIIILFADGAAPTQWDFGRYSSGLLATSPHGNYVTDSAAAASAMSTGFKVANGSISITPDGISPPTVMEAAKAAGKRIGLVTTAAVYDATPAAFALHSKSRRDSQALVDQLLALEPDVLMGGGREYFLPDSAARGKRKDGQDRTAPISASTCTG